MNNLATTHNIEPVATVKKIIRLKRVIELTGLSRSTIYDRINPKSKRYDTSFPKSIRLGTSHLNTGAVGWIESEVQEWIQQRIQASQSA
ncbi:MULTISPECIES: AlpA family transcriptional regulator [unclassified Acinetobacter]|uniref:helix-turn-helix transcriptional regulator n=1 Tax=unclassified Acinetobacter TaxID=196816 RepID=UPI0024468AAF|nr:MULTISPECIES: AlpA family transcriptional regulator [unclassified Acinetobacter]MDH0032950.1 AlpA family transcriptional regulator [Acinetobacter sp. GD04021]MDH0888328.1 AlpA family transcriptional regulator [Acinetobacter sp. GD03873]MDH1084759.1 AlpA family transcriptional regulator [Acinetobacter sp. GD03983]MDH2191649.1 AlpA family transcriptional regulator [Acinetobacter sp. GD03645]MDH2205242.1 AlpA family transcriptional regulator [Acinetobacter sp. GD03647]